MQSPKNKPASTATPTASLSDMPERDQSENHMSKPQAIPTYEPANSQFAVNPTKCGGGTFTNPSSFKQGKGRCERAKDIGNETLG